MLTVRRLQWHPERRIAVFRDRTGREGDELDGIAPRPRPELTVGSEYDDGDYEARFEHTLAFGAMLLPHDPDILAAHAHPFLHRDLSKNRAVGVPVLDALARSRAPLGPPASSALALGMAAHDARARIASQDALVDRARHGALDGAEFGRQAAQLLADGLVVGQRLSTGLTDVVRADDAAVHPVFDALQELLPALSGRRDGSGFLELAADLAERTGRAMALPDELRQVAAGRSASAMAKAVRRLV